MFIIHTPCLNGIFKGICIITFMLQHVYRKSSYTCHFLLLYKSKQFNQSLNQVKNPSGVHCVLYYPLRYSLQ